MGLGDDLTWRDIPGCPGRQVLRGACAALDAHVRAHGRRFTGTRARDPVWSCRFGDEAGGLLSYEHADGSFTHTRNTAAGLARKCADLGIPLEAVAR